MDPDIPTEDQKLFFDAEPNDERLRWVLNGRELGSAHALFLWTPVPGKYSLVLRDSLNRRLDPVDFVVRGRDSSVLPQ